MKNTKSSPTPTAAPRVTEAAGSFAGIDMPFRQTAAFETIMAATGSNEFDAAAKVISLGLFVLGLDPAGDYCLAEVTDALLGKDSEGSATTFDAIVAAGDAAGDAVVNAQRERRRQAYTGASNTQASA